MYSPSTPQRAGSVGDASADGAFTVIIGARFVDLDGGGSFPGLISFHLNGPQRLTIYRRDHRVVQRLDCVSAGTSGHDPRNRRARNDSEGVARGEIPHGGQSVHHRPVAYGWQAGPAFGAGRAP